jgi:hypothetical protein
MGLSYSLYHSRIGGKWCMRSLISVYRRFYSYASANPTFLILEAKEGTIPSQAYQRINSTLQRP